MERRWTHIALIVSALWIFYNTIFSGSILYFDSFGYEQLGEILAKGHWHAYLSGGPTREPLYPLFVALHMNIAQALQVPYVSLLLLTQGIVLLITQWMMARIFNRIGLSDKISAVLLLYCVISPTLLRSSLIVYSEIITYPFMLIPCLLALRIWQRFAMQERLSHYKRHALAFGAGFVPIVFIKGIAETIAPVVIIFFAYVLWARYKDLRKATIFAVIALLVFVVPVNAYKMLNKIYNGNFAFTNRGSGALYGSTARRVMPTTAREDFAQKLYVLPDKSICEAHAGKNACDHWFYELSDQISADTYQQLIAQRVPPHAIDQHFLRMSIDLMRAHPFRVLHGMFWEGVKLLFWEYPSWGMVILPRDIRYLYEQPSAYPLFIYGINIISVVLFGWSILYALRHWPRFTKGVMPALDALMITLVFLTAYILAHSFFFLNERNALPIVPLFLVLYGSLFKCLSYRGVR